MELETVESLRHQRNLLAEALGKLLQAYGVTRTDAALTGPELLMAAEMATEAAVQTAQQPQSVNRSP